MKRDAIGLSTDLPTIRAIFCPTGLSSRTSAARRVTWQYCTSYEMSSQPAKIFVTPPPPKNKLGRLAELARFVSNP